MEAPETTIQGPSSKEMLGYLIAIACGIFAAIQLVIFLFFRWYRVDFTNIFGGRGYNWTLNPWIFLLAVGIVFMASAWWRVCRKIGTATQKWLLAVCLGVSISIVVIGLCLSPPASYIPEHEPLLPTVDPLLRNHPLFRTH